MAASKGVNWYKSAKQRDSYWFAKAKNCFAVRVERLMAFRGVKKKDLAQTLGQSPANISKVLRGDSNPTIETMVKLVHALDAELDINIRPIGAPERPWLFEVNGGSQVNEKRTKRRTENAEIWKHLVEKGGGSRVAVYR